MADITNEAKKQIIPLKIERESDLYNPFDTEKNLSEDVKNYIENKIPYKTAKEDVIIRIIHSEPVNEEDVKAAFARWIDTSKAELKRLTKKNLLKMLCLFAFGIVLIALSLFLQPKVSTLLFTFITTLGTFSIWEGASVWIIQGPALRIQKKTFQSIIKATEIEFISAKEGNI